MTDAPHPEEDPPLMVGPEPVENHGVAAVAFILPAPAYNAIVTDEAPIEPPLPESLASTAPVPDQEPAGSVGAIRELGEVLGKRLDALQAIFEREARAEASRERVVDRLHAELQEYKQDLLLKVLRPVFVDLIQLHDDIGKLVAAEGGDGGDDEGRAGRLLDVIGGFQQGIEDILYRQGVEPFAVEDDAFDPRRQRAVAAVMTDDPTRNKAVAARLRKGFRAGEKIIRPEVVSVYAIKK